MSDSDEENQSTSNRRAAASPRLPLPASPARRVSFGEAFRFWVKLGFISFGGPAGQIAIMHRELVERRRWLSEERFLHALNYCMLLPGPEAQQLAIYIGWLMHRTLGGLVAGAFFVIPSIFVLLALSYVYAAYGHVPVVAGVLDGFKPVVVAIVVEAVLKIGKRALKGRVHLLIAAVAFVSIYFFRIPFPLIVLAAGLVGLALGDRGQGAGEKTKEKAAGDAQADTTADTRHDPTPVTPHEATPGAPDGPAPGPRRPAPAEPPAPLVIDDDAPPPEHTRPSRRRVFVTLAVGVALWLLPFALLLLWRGRASLHAQQYLYFTKAAFVTFGGAYAVLAYVTQAVTVEPYNWITPEQAVDGLALAETTPGPLIMVLQFVGFMAGWNHAEGMTRAASGVTGAIVTTYTTF
ncbi:MAG TPA: chromate transporter, partial [Pyrinomonadaceae bacterium]|nr:chromate transporter [Pyrinomonadaceae bacterium]